MRMASKRLPAFPLSARPGVAKILSERWRERGRRANPRRCCFFGPEKFCNCFLNSLICAKTAQDKLTGTSFVTERDSGFMLCEGQPQVNLSHRERDSFLCSE